MGAFASSNGSTCAPGMVLRTTQSVPAVDRAVRSVGTRSALYFRRYRWFIVLFVIATGAAAYGVSHSLTPLFEATTTIEIDYQQATGVIGQDALRPMPSNDSDDFMGTQVKLIMSDSVLRPVAEKYHLLELEKQIGGTNSATDQRVRLAPINLKRLRVSRQPGTMLLLISYRSPSPGFSADIANEIAADYVNRVFELRAATSASLSRFMDIQFQELKAKMYQSNKKLAEFEREMSIINPEQRTSVLSARLLQLSEEYTRAQAVRMRKEASFTASKTGTPEAAQLSTQGDILSRIDEMRIGARQALAAAGANLGRNHPDYLKAKAEVDELDRQFDSTTKSIDSRIGTDYAEAINHEQMLEHQIKNSKSEYDQANQHVFSYAQLKREADEDRIMYGELLRKVRESSINAGFQNHTIRVADEARPPSRPISPNVPLNVVFAMISATILSAGCLISVSSRDDTLRGARATSEMLNVQVLGALPMVHRLERATLADRKRSLEYLVSGLDSSSQEMDLASYEESVRKLRNTLDVARSIASVRSLLVTSAMPGEGKSMVAGDLAISFATMGRKTLLIDADLRRPILHERFELPNTVGLSEVLAGTFDWEGAVKTCESYANLLILTSGKANLSPADVVGPSIEKLIEGLREEFDLVVIDAPPILPFAEPIRIAASVDSVVLVARSGKTTLDSAKNVLSTLEWVGANVLGVILTHVPRTDDDMSYQRRAYKIRSAAKSST